MIIFISFVSEVYSDVVLKGELVIQESIVGAKYLGEVTNNSDTAVTDVKVTIVAKNETAQNIDVSSGYVDGYSEPDGWSDSFIPKGETVPFYFFGDAEADSIASYECTITYKNSDKTYIELFSVSNISQSSNWLSTSIFGEITNLSSQAFTFANIVFAFNDSEGKIIAVENAYVKGCSHIPSEDTTIFPGNSAPYELLLISSQDYASYYTIVNYSTSISAQEQFGYEEIVVDGELSIINDNNNVRYVGYIGNNTTYDIYFVEVCFISRDIDGKILDISYSFVDGTNYEYMSSLTTDTHISPFAKAPFEVSSNASYDKMTNYETRIYFSKADTPSNIENKSPEVFVLKQNYPNPFNPTTTIEFSLADYSPVELKIFNCSGQLIEELVNGYFSAGTHTIQWDASLYPSGIYFYRLVSGMNSENGKMLLVK